MINRKEIGLRLAATAAVIGLGTVAVEEAPKAKGETPIVYKTNSLLRQPRIGMNYYEEGQIQIERKRVAGIDFEIDETTINELGMARIRQILEAMKKLEEEGKLPASRWPQIAINGGEGGAGITPMTRLPGGGGKVKEPIIIMPDCYRQAVADHPEEAYQLWNLTEAMSIGFTTVGPEAEQHWQQLQRYADLIMEKISQEQQASSSETEI